MENEQVRTVPRVFLKINQETLRIPVTLPDAQNTYAVAEKQQDGKLHGRLYVVSGDLVILRGRYVCGQRDAKLFSERTYHDLSVQQVRAFDSGIEDGERIVISPSFQMTMTMDHGKPTGPFSYTSNNTLLKVRGQLLDGLRHGKWQFYEGACNPYELDYDRGRLQRDMHPGSKIAVHEGTQSV